MQKLSFSAFDFFSYAFPGVCILGTMFLLDPSIHSASDILAKADEIGIGGGILLTIVGYLTGFAISPLGRWLYKSLGFRIWYHGFENVEGLSVSEKYTLLREYTQENFKYVETWNVLCAMSHNLAFASLLAFVSGIIRMIAFPGIGAPIAPVTVGLSFLLFWLFLHRAVVFYRWAAIDINSAVKILKLADKKT